MKTIATLILALLLQTGFAQIADNTFSHNERNIYYQALKHYLDFRANDSFYSKYGYGRIDTLYVYRDSKTTDSLLESIGETRIIYVENPFTYIRKKKVKGLTLYSIFPLSFYKSEFAVSFIPYGVSIYSKRKKTLVFLLSGKL